MTPTIIDGKAVADAIRAEIADKVKRECADGRRPPGLAAIIVGADPASQSYVRGKRKAAEAAGFHSVVHELPSDVARDRLLRLVDSLNADPAIDGILCQVPLPKHLDEFEVTLRIDPDKDVDGFHPINAGRLALGMRGFVPCTPAGCRELLLRYKIETAGKRAVVLGRSSIVGTPMSILLSRKGPGGDATVTIAHSKTRDLPSVIRDADILVAAIGRPRFVTRDMIKPGAAILDVGINRIDDAASPKGYRVVGDVDFEAAKEIASAITPVPGGVGLMTVAMLMSNTFDSWSRR